MYMQLQEPVDLSLYYDSEDISFPIDEFKILSDEEEYALSGDEKLEYYNRLKAYYLSDEYISATSNPPKVNRDISKEGIASLTGDTQAAFGNRNSFLNYLKDPNPENVLSEKGVKIRQEINPVIRTGLPLMIPYRMNVIKRAEMPEGKPIIYAPTHGFKDDVACSIATMDDHAYILFGSLPQFYNTIDGITAWAIGSIIVDRTDPESRKASFPKMVYAQELGSNLMWFTEGVWNISINAMVLKLYSGIYDIAKETGALVAPVATLVDKRTCYSLLDEAFDITQYNKAEGIQILRDKMATARWELMREAAIKRNKKGKFNRSTEIVYRDKRDRLPISTDVDRMNDRYFNSPLGQAVYDRPIDSYNPVTQKWNKYVERLIRQVKCYDRVVEAAVAYKDKTIWEQEDVFNYNIEVDNGPVLAKTMHSSRH